MPKFPILLLAAGLLIAILGCVVTGVIYAIQLTGSFNNTMNVATNSDEEAAKFCTENEKLVSINGPSQRISGSNSYGHSVSYYCENSEGKRRDITAEFEASLVGKVGDLFSSAFSVRWEFLCGSGVGLLMVGAGIAMLVMRRQRGPTPTGGAGGPFVPLQ